jgi:hypothetical protein
MPHASKNENIFPNIGAHAGNCFSGIGYLDTSSWQIQQTLL